MRTNEIGYSTKAFLLAGAIFLFLTGAAFAQQQRQGAQAVTIDLAAQNNAFDKSAITVPAGARVIVRFTNRDAAPHNFAVYRSAEAREGLFAGERVNGPNRTVQYELTAPQQPGTYFFRCDVHPRAMTGDFIVQ
jgi:plastocyanin